jgi:hypothetical protein
MNVEIWFDPSGTRLHRVMPREASKSDSAAQAEPTNAQTPPLTPGEKITATFPPTLDPKADREKLFGPSVAFRENSGTGFGKGSMLRYRDGTVELFLEGSTKSIVFRPGPNGLYIIYWEVRGSAGPETGLPPVTPRADAVSRRLGHPIEARFGCAHFGWIDFYGIDTKPHLARQGSGR